MFRYFNKLPRLLSPLVLIAATTTQTPSCNSLIPPALPETATTDALSRQAADTQTSSVNDWDQCPELLSAAPRGLSCLQCLQPEAREQSVEVIKMLVDSCLKNVAINYLVDGSFSFDESFLQQEIAVLTAGERHLSILFYLSNGPSQRKYPRALLNGYALDMSAEDFRENIKSDESLQAGFRQVVKRLVPTLEFAQAQGAEILLVPMLEDNLDEDAFLTMARLAKAELPVGLNVRFGRNPCPGCSDGADNVVPQGFFRESHNIKNASRITNGVISNDGNWTELESRFQSGNGSVTLDALRDARDASAANGNLFLLWSASRQGLYYSQDGRQNRRAAAERSYALPDLTERQATMLFLREGAQ